MTHADILALFDHERQTLTPANTAVERADDVVRHLPIAGDQYWVMYSSHAEDELDAAIEREKTHLASLSPRYTSLEWKAYDHDQPATLVECLAAHGFEIGEPEAFLVLDIADAPADLLAPVTQDVRRVTDAQGVRDYFAVSVGVFDDDHSGWRDELERQVISSDPSVSVYVAYDGDVPVSSSRISFEPNSQCAGLWGGATLESHRGKGYYKALVAARLQEAKQRGVRFLFIDASPMSRPILERRGFRFLDYTRPCVWPAQ
jgi:GNAT superfamily N-acetyltransferase